MGLFFKKHLTFKELNLVLDGELKGASVIRAEKHLSECAPCARSLGDLRKVSQSVSEFGFRLRQAANAESLWPRIEEALTRKKEAHVSWRDRLGVRLPVFVMRPALALSVVVFLVVFTFFVFQRMTLADNEAIVNSVSSESKLVMIFKTKERKITVIWLMDRPTMNEKPIELSSRPPSRDPVSFKDTGFPLSRE